MKRRLLVLNCHEPWVHQLSALDAELDIVVGLAGRHVTGWDERLRPVPHGARLLTLDEARALPPTWDCIIGHNLTDLFDTAMIDAPTLLVIHDVLEGRMAQQGAEFTAEEMRASLATYVAQRGIHVMPVSALKGRSWGIDAEGVTFAADPDDYPAFHGTIAAGLRVANHVTSKRIFLNWEFHEAAFEGLPVTLIGHNPDRGIAPAPSWHALKASFAAHRFFIHTADTRWEDGYNMASVEAMAAGMPVLSNVHPSCPLKHGVDGFVAREPAELRDYALRLLDDVALATTMGAQARQTAVKRFGPSRFARGVMRAIDAAQRKFRQRRRAA